VFTGSRESTQRQKSKYVRKATLGICGDPIVGRTLVLLLRGPDYSARFLPAHSLGEPQEVLKDVRLLVLTPTPELSLERRNALVRSLKEISEAGNIPVLELAINFEASQEEARNESWHMVPWPCRIGDLEGWIASQFPRRYPFSAVG
jgi:hypothetical protein